MEGMGKGGRKREGEKEDREEGKRKERGWEGGKEGGREEGYLAREKKGVVHAQKKKSGTVTLSCGGIRPHIYIYIYTRQRSGHKYMAVIMFYILQAAKPYG
jgi:hypothetical protein